MCIQQQTGDVLVETGEPHHSGFIFLIGNFNKVRNEQTFAHDNEVLNYHESLLIFNNICSVIRFLQSTKIESDEPETIDDGFDDIPF